MSDAPDFAPDRRSTVVTEQSIERQEFSVAQFQGIPNGDTETLTLDPGTGKLLEVTALRVVVNGNAGSGDHTFRVRNDPGQIIDSIELTQPASEPIQFEGVAPRRPSSATTVFPSDLGALAQAVRALRATSADPVELTYLNNTGQQSQTVGIQATGVARRIA
jgi:hypothetical protein